MTELLLNLEALLGYISNPDVRGCVMDLKARLETGQREIEAYKQLGHSGPQLHAAQTNLREIADEAELLLLDLRTWADEARTETLAVTVHVYPDRNLPEWVDVKIVQNKEGD